MQRLPYLRNDVWAEEKAGGREREGGGSARGSGDPLCAQGGKEISELNDGIGDVHVLSCYWQFKVYVRSGKCMLQKKDTPIDICTNNHLL